MSKISEKFDIDLESLSSRDKAALAHYLIEELDGKADKDVEEIWRKEAESRYQAYKNNELSSVSGNEAMLKARDSLK